jgi:hypothetical protein
MRFLVNNIGVLGMPRGAGRGAQHLPLEKRLTRVLNG